MLAQSNALTLRGDFSVATTFATVLRHSTRPLVGEFIVGLNGRTYCTARPGFHPPHADALMHLIEGCLFEAS